MSTKNVRHFSYYSALQADTCRAFLCMHRRGFLRCIFLS